MRIVWFAIANRWALKALELHEILGKIHFVPSILYWNIPERKFRYREPGDWRLNVWYFSLLISVLGILLCLTCLIWHLHEIHNFPIVTCGACLFFLCMACLGFGADIVFLFYVEDFVTCLNHLVSYGALIRTAERRFGLQTRKFEDFIGLFALRNVIFFHLVPCILVPVGLVFHPELDPIHWSLQHVLGKSYPQTLPVLLWYLVFSLRFFLCFLFNSQVLRAISQMCQIMLLETPIFHFLLNHYNKRHSLDFPVLSQYTKLSRIRNINQKACAELTSIAMGACFAFGTVTNAACLYGYE